MVSFCWSTEISFSQLTWLVWRKLDQYNTFLSQHVVWIWWRRSGNFLHYMILILLDNARSTLFITVNLHPNRTLVPPCPTTGGPQVVPPASCKDRGQRHWRRFAEGMRQGGRAVVRYWNLAALNDTHQLSILMSIWIMLFTDIHVIRMICYEITFSDAAIWYTCCMDELFVGCWTLAGRKVGSWIFFHGNCQNIIYIYIYIQYIYIYTYLQLFQHPKNVFFSPYEFQPPRTTSSFGELQ